MMEIDTILLNDNKEYFILQKLDINNTIYLLLSNVNAEKDIKIGKEIYEDDSKYFVGINDENEFKKVLESFNNKLNG